MDEYQFARRQNNYKSHLYFAVPDSNPQYSVGLINFLIGGVAGSVVGPERDSEMRLTPRIEISRRTYGRPFPCSGK